MEIDAAGLLSDLLGLSAQAQAERLRPLGPPGPVLSDLAEEAGRWAITDLHGALEATRQIVELADAIGDGCAQARTRRARAQVLAYANRNEEALAAADDSARRARAAGRPVDEARARMSMMQVLDRLGRSDESIDIAETARSAFLAAGEEALAARAEVNLGTAYRRRGDPAGAIERFDRARAVLGSDPVIAAQVDSNRAEALLDLNDFREAELAFRSSLTAFEKAGFERAAALVEGNLADLMSRQGRLDRALYHFERSRRHFEAIGSSADRARRARLAAEQAEAFARAGLVTEALDAYRAALPRLDEHELGAEAARARLGLGEALHVTGRDDEAETEVSRATEVFRALGDDAAYGRGLLAQGKLAQRREGLDAGANLFREAARRLSDRPVEAAVAQGHLARIALARGELAPAGALLDDALEAARSGNVAPLLADLLHARAHLRRAQQRPDLELEDLRAAVVEVERLRGSMQAERLRSAFLGERTAVYEDLVRNLLTRGDAEAVAEAFHAVERAKSRSLLDLAAGVIEGDALTIDGGDDPTAAALLHDTAERRRELNALYSRFEEVSFARGTALTQWRSRVEATEQALQTLEARLAATRVHGGMLAPPIDGREVRTLIDHGAAIVEYYIAGPELHAFVVRDDGISAHAGLADASAVTEQVERVQFELGRATGWAVRSPDEIPGLVPDAQRELTTLHAMLVAPLADDLTGADRLTVVPHGPLHGVPFPALHDGRRYLVEDHEITYAPSASLLRCLAPGAERGTGSGARSVVLGVPDDAAPQIDEEVRAIATTLQASCVLTGDEVTRERLRKEVAGAAVVHLACHARFSPRAPLSSGLRLADGWLTVRDLYDLPLRHAMVVLSACDTGRSAIGKGDEPTGLVRGLLAAGASTVVLSLWMLNDGSGKDLMNSFYGFCYDGSRVRPSAAMRAAQLEIMATRPHPVFWAPLIVLGRP